MQDLKHHDGLMRGGGWWSVNAKDWPADAIPFLLFVLHPIANASARWSLIWSINCNETIMWVHTHPLQSNPIAGAHRPCKISQHLMQKLAESSIRPTLQIVTVWLERTDHETGWWADLFPGQDASLAVNKRIGQTCGCCKHVDLMECWKATPLWHIEKLGHALLLQKDFPNACNHRRGCSVLADCMSRFKKTPTLGWHLKRSTMITSIHHPEKASAESATRCHVASTNSGNLVNSLSGSLA